MCIASVAARLRRFGRTTMTRTLWTSSGPEPAGLCRNLWQQAYSPECVEGEFSEVRLQRRPGPLCLLHFGAAVRFAPFKPPGGAGTTLPNACQRHPVCSSHRLLLVGSQFLWLLAPALHFGPSRSPKK